MEGVPRLPMLSFRLKTSPEPANFAPSLKTQIRDKFQEDPSGYSNEIRELEGLRASACHPTQDFAGCSVLKKYYSQLHLLQSRFTFEDMGQLDVVFTWSDLYNGAFYSTTELKHEMACVLYNVGALHTQLGGAENRQTADGMKNSCTHYQCAAWAFQMLNEQLLQPKETDLCPDIITFMSQVSLAQAQECILEKSMVDGRKAGIVAKVAAQIVDYYKQALKTLDKGYKSAEGSPVEEVVGTKIYKNWRRYVEFKMGYHRCISSLYMGMQCEETQKMGERVAYYQVAMEKLSEVTKLAKSLEQQERVNEAIPFTHDVVGGKLKAAEKENEYVYHEKVPDKNLLPEVKGASLVKGIPFDVKDPEIYGKDIFHRLVPMEAHEASSLYSEEKAKLLRKVGTQVDEKDEELVLFLTSLQVDQLKLHSEPETLPQELVNCCAALSAQPNAVQSLTESMSRLSSVYHEVEASLNEAQQILDEETEKEKAFQGVVGKRPPSIILKQLSLELSKLKEAHLKAAESNSILHKAMSSHLTNLRTLSLPLAEIQAQLPSVQGMESPKDVTAVKEIQRLLDKVEEMRRQRAMLYAQLREAITADDITKQLATQDSNLEGLFSKELSKHQRLVTLIEQNLSAQDKILNALTETNARYADTRRVTSERARQRSSTVAVLIGSYEAYQELLLKSEKGLEFYTKLEANVGKLLKRLSSVCKVQDEEREQHHKHSAKAITQSLPTDTPPVEGPKLKDYLHLMKRDQNNARPTPLGAEQNETPRYHTSGTSTDATYPYSGYQPQQGYQSQQYYPADRNFGSAATSFTESTLQPTSATPQYTQDGSKFPTQNYGYPDTFHYAAVTTSVLATQHSNMAATVGTTSATATTTAQNHYHYQKGYPASSHGNSSAYSSATADTGSMSAQYYHNQYGYHSGYATQYGSVPAGTAASSNTAQNAYSQYYQATQQYATVSSTATLPATAVNNAAPDASKYHGYHGSQSYHQATVTSTPATQFRVSDVATSTPSSFGYSYPRVANSVASSSYLNSQTASVYSHPSATPASEIYVNSVASYTQADTTSAVAPVPATAAIGTSINPVSFSGTTDTTAAASYSTSVGSGASYYGSLASYSTADTTRVAPASTTPYGLPQEASTSVQGYTQGVSGPVSTATAASLPQVSTYQTPASSVYATYGSQPYSEYYSSTQYGLGYQYYPYYTQASSSASYTPYATTASMYLHYTSTATTPVTAATLAPSSATPAPSAATTGRAHLTNGTSFKHVSNVDLLSLLDVTVPDVSSNILQPIIPGPAVAPDTSTATATNLSTLSQVEPTPSPVPLAAASVTETKSTTDEPAVAVVPKDDTQVLLPTTSTKPGPVTVAKDPLADPEAATRFAVEVEKLEKLVEGLNRKSLNGPTPLDLKWKEVQEQQEKESLKRSISVARCYPMKNRYPDVLPYDHNRVELPTTKDDYINATHIAAPSPHAPCFIATQLPVPCTQADFWTMIWMQQVELIVCLLSDTEMKTAPYWPAEKGRDLVIGPWIISLQSVIQKQNGVERILSLTQGSTKANRVLIHYQFTAWPGSSFPATPAALLGFTCDLLHFWRLQRSQQHPVVVHCLGGAGRTGLFCLLTAALAEISAGNGFIDVVRTAGLLCQQRRNIFRDREHLLFAYQAILYYAQDLLLKRGILSTRKGFDERPASAQASPARSKQHSRHPSQDFIEGSSSTGFTGEFASLSRSDSMLSVHSIDSVSSKGSTKILSVLDPTNFTLDSLQPKTSEKTRFTKESFMAKSSNISLSVKPDPNDPLSQLDPLWSLGK